jgi:hypothetical protein
LHLSLQIMNMIVTSSCFWSISSLLFDSNSLQNRLIPSGLGQVGSESAGGEPISSWVTWPFDKTSLNTSFSQIDSQYPCNWSRFCRYLWKKKKTQDETILILIDIILGVWEKNEMSRWEEILGLGQETRIVCNALIILAGLDIWTRNPFNINILFGLSYSRIN